ncbi:glutathione S-transferase family protein [Phenylobacterium sp. LjRoot225]|uniref:glutathione S-transferase family protein n=1 Tax=Phenylobacterium sp. LjRoot225 TaxID=3342285 RepID=UPI003ECF6CF7
MRLYHCDNARSFRVLWTFEELGLPYDLVTMPFPPSQTTPAYLNENPLGTVPLLVDGDTRMTESGAICQYLAERYPDGGLALGPEDPRYGDYLNALHYGEATLTFPQAVYLRYALFEPKERRNPAVADDYRLWFHARLCWLEALLGRAPYVAGEQFTVADICVGYALMLAQHIGLGDLLSSAQRDYLGRLSRRPAFERAIARQSPP